MKHSKKMVLVDYDQYNVQTVDQFINTDKSKYTRDLDTQISKILQNDELGDHDKCKLYMETLRKYLHFMQEDLKNKEQKTVELNKDFKNLVSKLETEFSVKPAVKRLSNGHSPLKRKRIIKSSKRKPFSRIPKLKKVPPPMIENWTTIKIEPRDE
jgi:hypothetical protein